MHQETLDQITQQAHYLAKRALYSNVSSLKKKKIISSGDDEIKIIATTADFSYTAAILNSDNTYDIITSCAFDKDERDVYSFDIGIEKNVRLTANGEDIFLQELKNNMMIPLGGDSFVKTVIKLLMDEDNIVKCTNGAEYAIESPGQEYSFGFRFRNDKGVYRSIIIPNPENKKLGVKFFEPKNTTNEEIKKIRSVFNQAAEYILEYLENNK